MSLVPAPARKKNSWLPGLSPPLPLIFPVLLRKTWFVYACLYVLRVEKRKGCKKSRVEVLWVFMDPPHWLLIAMRGRKQEEGGGVLTVKEMEENDGTAVIYEVTEERILWCQRGLKCAREAEGRS